MADQSQSKVLIIAGIAILLIVGGYYIMTKPDPRNTSEKLADAVEELPNGIDKAARQMEDRTPAEKLGDAAEDAGDDLKKATNQE